MPTIDLTRTLNMHQKRGVCVAVVEIKQGPNDPFFVSADTYQLMQIPPRSLIIAWQLENLVANDDGTGAVADIGITGDIDLLADGVNLRTAVVGTSTTILPPLEVTTDGNAQANLAVDNVQSPIWLPTGTIITFLPTYTGADATEGTTLLTIEYIEVDKVTGELTAFITAV